MLLHDSKESNDDLGRGSDENLTLSTLLSVVDVVEAVGLQKRTTLSAILLFALPDSRWTYKNGDTHGYELLKSSRRRKRLTVKGKIRKKKERNKKPSDHVRNTFKRIPNWS